MGRIVSVRGSVVDVEFTRGELPDLCIARQPESAGTISRTLFVGLGMIETTAIYCLVIALLLLFANPYVG